MAVETSNEIELTTFEDVRLALINSDLSRSLDPERHEHGNILDQVLMVLDEDAHRVRRRVENRLFRQDTLLLYERQLFPHIIRSTLARSGLDGHADLVELGSLLTVVLSARTVGIDFDTDSLDERRRLVELRHVFSRGISIDAATVDIDELKAEVRKALNLFEEEFFRPSLERRRGLLREVRSGRMPEDQLPRDLVMTLVLAQSELELSDALLLREAAFFLDAGSDTSTQALTSTLHFMFRWCELHPTGWRRLQNDRLFAQRCVHESLRLRPTNTRIMRRAVRDTTVGEQHISAHTKVRLNTGSANSDHAVYGPDADRFDPHRALPVTVPRFGHSFSGGVHACIGRNQAVGLPIRFQGDAPANHQFGLVTLMVQGLVERGVRPDVDLPPTVQAGTKRITRWEHYPVLISPPPGERFGDRTP